MYILGIDPGVACGLAVVVFEDNAAPLCRMMGCVHARHKLLSDPEEVAGEIYERIRKESHHWGSHEYPLGLMALEMPQHGPSMAVFAGQMRMIGSLKTRLPGSIHFVNPTNVKKTITGNGRADKNEMLRVLMPLFPTLNWTPSKIEREAIADAIGHAITLALRLGWIAPAGMLPTPVSPRSGRRSPGAGRTAPSR